MNLKLQLDQGILLADPLLYRKLIGKLNFLTHTRLDLAFVVQFLSQFMQAPRHPHMDADFHVLGYLKGTSHLGLLLTDSDDFQLKAFCDADWVS